jgi:F420-dependent oxidoreductase-like protein
MQLRIMTEPQQGAEYTRQLAVARAAEELGFDAFFRSDHYLSMGDGDGLPGPTDAWLTLAGLAVQTSRIKLGTLVSPVTFRYPGPLAISVAQVDDMSGGRVELGIGAGWFQAEHAACGIPFPDTAERFDRLEEQLAIITGLWQTPIGERFSFAGKFYPITDSPGLPKPAQRPHPPILLGGKGPRRTPQLAARYADEFNVPFSTIEDTRAAFGRVREACQAAGRNPDSLVYSAAQTVCCGRDEAELARRAAAIGWDLATQRADGLVGSPDEIVDRIGTLAGLGVTRVYLQVLDLHDLDHLELIAAEVLPQVR